VKERRALTMQTRPARLDRHGDPKLADQLARALDVADVSEEQERRYTHGFHSYPARMHPLTARRVLAMLELPRGALLVDPFCGSGTVLVEGVLAGARTVGVDANPLAVAIARAKTWMVSSVRRKELQTVARRIAAMVHEEGKAARRSGYEGLPDRKPPPGMTATERAKQLEGWFEPHIRRELETIATFIDQEKDEELRALLQALLSSVILKVSRRESDTSGQMVSRKLARGMAARLFGQRADELVDGLALVEKDSKGRGIPPLVWLGDARSIPRKELPAGLPDGAAQAVLSSPPYAGTYDYLEHHQLRLLLLGLPAGSMEAQEIGARRSFGATPKEVALGLKKWGKDLKQSLSQMARVLEVGGRAVLLLGDSLAGRGPAAQAVYADMWLAELAPEVGLEIVAAASMYRVELGAAERRAFELRPKREHLVLLRKRPA
jgi:SAM-dependent methyltransferase